MVIPSKAIIIGYKSASGSVEVGATTLGEILLQGRCDIVGVAEIEVLRHVNRFEGIH